MIWDDNNRYDQTGYSSPTIFPQVSDYSDLDKFLKDISKAVSREASRREWLEEELEEARLDYKIEQQEQKLRNKEDPYGY